ncbi:siderophore-interacting protein [Streptomyces sp. NPDC048057]|uniref:siderophore-interacting protein n=1 Tax=Streptomyces sp. NPDC048057 TaxID=3155628 RepID=UPI003405BA7D
MSLSPFHGSPNVLFETRVRAVRRLSPGFVRLTLCGPSLDVFAPYGLDQRVKLLVPEDGYAAAFDFDGDVLPESQWRARWRALPEAERPAMRSYTTSGIRPAAREVDVDFYVHARPGPASGWAARAREGERVLLSGPDVRRSDPSYGIQWSPGRADRFLLVGDETAFPAIRNIMSSLGPSARVRAVLEVGDAADVAVMGEPRAGHEVTAHRRRDGSTGALTAAVDAWIAERGAEAAALGEGFYAWLATESTRVAGLRDRLRAAGVPPHRIHAQGYWHDRVRS